MDVIYVNKTKHKKQRYTSSYDGYVLKTIYYQRFLGGEIYMFG